MGSLKNLYSRMGERRVLRLVLLALGLPIFLFGLGSPGLYDPHEAQYAEIAQEMLIRQDWVTPHLNDARYLDKPPLFYWLIALSYFAFGISEFSARFPMAMAALGGVLVTRSIGEQLFNGGVGFIAGVVLMTSLGYFLFSRQILPDLVFSFFTTLSFSLFLLGSVGDRYQKRYSSLFSISLALAVLTKGLLGLFPLFVIGLYLFLTGELRQLRAMVPFWGGLLFLIITAPWHLAIGWQNEGYFWQYLVNEHLLRFMGRRDPLDYISLPLPVFCLIFFLWILPWSAYLPLAVSPDLFRQGKDMDREKKGSLFLLLWAGFILVFFSVSQARLAQYPLPAIPALALLIGKVFDDRFIGKVPSVRGLLISTAISVLLPTMAFLLVPAYLERYHQVALLEQLASIKRNLLTIFTIILGGGVLALLAFSRRRLTFGFLSLIFSMIAAFFFVHRGLVLLEPIQSSKPLAALITGERKPSERIVLEIEKEEPFEYEKVSGLVFYTGRKVYVLRRRNPPTLPFPLKPEERFLLREADFHQLWQSGERIYLVTDSLFDGDGVLDGRFPFFILGKVGNRWVVSNKTSS